MILLIIMMMMLFLYNEIETFVIRECKMKMPHPENYDDFESYVEGVLAQGSTTAATYRVGVDGGSPVGSKGAGSHQEAGGGVNAEGCGIAATHKGEGPIS